MDIVVFLTGGTIGMRLRKEGVVPSGDLHALLVGERLVKGAKIRTIVWSDKPSPHMTADDMLRLAHDIDRELEHPDVVGAVVLHGTDLLAETSFFLDMVLISNKPVVTTGSMRHMEEAGYDGQRNVLNAIITCLAMPFGSEVVLQMADEIFAARDAVKLDSISINPFVGQQRGHIGRIVNSKVQFNQNVQCIRPRLPFFVTGLAHDIPIVACWPGMIETELAVTLGESDMGFTANGIILEGFGAGNIPPGILPVVRRFLRTGKPLVLTTRCVLGGVSPIYGYLGGAAELEDLGAILAGNLGTLKAQLLLKIILGSNHAAINLQQLFF